MYPFFEAPVSAGFPVSIDDVLRSEIDICAFLIKHKASTFFVRVAGDSMIGAGIHHNDILVVDKSIVPVSGKIVIAVVDNEMMVKRYVKEGKTVVFVSENPEYPPIFLNELSQVYIWGVVTSVIHRF